MSSEVETKQKLNWKMLFMKILSALSLLCAGVLGLAMITEAADQPVRRDRHDIRRDRRDLREDRADVFFQTIINSAARNEDGNKWCEFWILFR